MIRMAPKSLGLWVLFLWIQKCVSAACGNHSGILGEDAELKCCYNGEDFKSNSFRVQWQLEDKVDCLVAAYLPDEIPPPQCECYQNRTHLKNNYLHLQLLNLNLGDSKIYKCILQKKIKDKYQMIFQGWIRLEVAANISTNTTKYPELPTSNPVTNDSQQQTQVVTISSLLAAVVIIIIIILLIKYKRKYSIHRRHTGGGE